MRRQLYERYLGLCDNKRNTISLQKDLSPEDLRLTLLHEMYHIDNGPGYQHGPRFLRKVRRLVKLGESKMIEDLERYDGTAAARDYESMPTSWRALSMASRFQTIFKNSRSNNSE